MSNRSTDSWWSGYHVHLLTTDYRLLSSDYFFMLPVFFLELLLAQRRDRYGKLQRRYLRWLSFLCLVALWRLAEEAAGVHRVWTAFFLQFCLLQHAAILFFLTPAFLAGSIADERQQGTLADLLTTDLSPAQILAGKACAALVQISNLLLVALPPLAFCAGCGFLEPAAVPGLMLLTATWLVVLSSLSLCASVFSALARVAVVRVYAAVGGALLLSWFYVDELQPWLLRRISPPVNPAWIRELGRWLHSLNPSHVLQPLWMDSDWDLFVVRFSRFALIAVIVCGTAFAAAVSCLRARSTPIPARRRAVTRRRLPSLEVGDLPILWRESLVSRPGRQMLGILLTFLAGLAVSVYSFQAEVPGLGLLAGSVCIAVAASLPDRRCLGIRRYYHRAGNSRTWDSPAEATPVESKSLVEEKARAAMQGATPFLLASFLPVLAAAIWTGFTAGVAVLVVAFLGRAVTHYMAAIGLVSSARARGSWRSLLATLVTGYSRIMLFLTMIGVICICYGSIFPQYFLLTMVMPRLNRRSGP